MARPRPQWHLEDIKAELRKQFGDLRALSLRWGLSRAAISNTLTNPRYSMPIELRIAEVLNEKPSVLWPLRWSPDGEPLPRTYPGGGSQESQKKDAA